MRRSLVIAGLALLGVAGTVYALFRSEVDPAREAVRRGGTMVATAVGPVEYAQTGAGPTVLSIHGAGGGYDQGLANGIGLFGKNYRIIAPSRFGYLHTPVPHDSSDAAQADAHAALLDKLHVQKAIVIGVSAGARSAAELALRHPERVSALVLMVPGTYAPGSPVGLKPSRGNKFVFWVVNTGGDFIWWAAEKIAPSMLIRFVGVPPDVIAAASKPERDRMRAMLASVEPLSDRFVGINVDSTPGLHPWPAAKIAVPTLIVTAKDDLFNTLPAARYAASRISGAKLIVYERGGHLLIGRDVGAVVRAFAGDAIRTPAPAAKP